MKEDRKQRLSIKNMVFIGLFAAVISLLAQISIPTPWQIAFTLQTFAVALAGFCLGRTQGVAAVIIYVLLGIIGVPVFTGFGAGIAAVVRPDGGYIWGFLFLSLACGMRETVNKKWLAILIGIAGLMICYICGTVQFALLTGRTIAEAMVLTVLPYAWKDVISVAAAYGISVPVRKIMNRER